MDPDSDPDPEHWLKGPRYEDFWSKVLTLSKPIWTGDLRTERKITFCTFDGRSDVFSSKIVASSVADPECLSRIPDPTFFNPGSELSPTRIPDPHQRI